MNIISVDLQDSFEPGFSKILHFSIEIAFFQELGVKVTFAEIRLRLCVLHSLTQLLRSMLYTIRATQSILQRKNNHQISPYREVSDGGK